MAQHVVPQGCLSHLLSLSDEILVIIFSLLNTEDLSSLSKVCRRFDGILMDRKLCRDVTISPKSDASCLDYIFPYFRKRRKLIRSINISSCYWIPLPKVMLMTKSLSNLVTLNVMNIRLPSINLVKILKETNQLRELSWSWINDDKAISWSEVASDERKALAGLEKLHFSLSHPWHRAARELYGFCHNLTHLTVEVHPVSRTLPIPRTNIGENLPGPTKLKSLIVWRNSGPNDSIYDGYHILDFDIGQMLMHFWVICGEFNRAWECLWTNAFDVIPWRNVYSSSQVGIIPTNLESIVLHSADFTKIQKELPITQLIIHIPVDQEETSFPPLVGVAPNLQKFALITNRYSEVLNLWINAVIGTLENLVELNLFGVHYCCDHGNVDKLWIALKSLEKLKKLAVLPCVLPRYAKGTNPQLIGGKEFLVSHTVKSEVDKKIEDLLRLTSVEYFEVGNPNDRVHPSYQDAGCCHGDWVPYIAVVSSWPNLLFLSLNSIVSIRSLQHLKLIALGCKNLTTLRVKNLGMKGHCSYVKDIAVALPHFQALKHFRLHQHHIYDHIKNLLLSLSHCVNLETIIIMSPSFEKSRLVKKEDLKGRIIQLTNNCPFLTLIHCPLPEVSIQTCNKIKNEIMKCLPQPRQLSMIMDFCSDPNAGTLCSEGYHGFVKFPCRSDHCDELNMFSAVALSPPWKHTR